MCWLCSDVFFVVGSASEDIHEYPTEGQYPTTTPSGKQPLIIPIQTHVLAFALVYCIKTTRFKLLCATVVEPLSSAWPVIATVTRWNPLACVGVDWAMYAIPTLLCLLCLELCQVWFIWVMGQSEMLMPVMWGMCWTCFGKGIDERPCRSTWWVVSLRPSIRTEICMCDLRCSYYRTLGSKPMDPLGFLITLVLCPGVAISFWCL